MTQPFDVDHSSPVPLYHQIVQAIRYRIATGALRPGAVLPPLREAATLWGVNLHTVRRAYVELAREGLVSTEVPRGTVVLPRGGHPEAQGGNAALDRFLDGVIRGARQKHDLTLDQLVDLLGRRRAPLQANSAPTVYVVECSETQSADLAVQLRARWRVATVPWPLGRPAPPGRGPIVATYFHYGDIRSSWPGRIGDVRFLGIRPDPDLGKLLERSAPERRGRIPVTFCEREESMLHNIASDLTQSLPSDRFDITPRLVTQPAAWMSRYRGEGPVLFSPRVWGDLPGRWRADPRALEARYVFEPKDLESIGPALNWRSP
jgi:DNA-binding transcriptional regulator YhcF (GntR family)